MFDSTKLGMLADKLEFGSLDLALEMDLDLALDLDLPNLVLMGAHSVD